MYSSDFEDGDINGDTPDEATQAILRHTAKPPTPPDEQETETEIHASFGFKQKTRNRGHHAGSLPRPTPNRARLAWSWLIAWLISKLPVGK